MAWRDGHDVTLTSRAASVSKFLMNLPAGDIFSTRCPIDWPIVSHVPDMHEASRRDGGLVLDPLEQDPLIGLVLEPMRNLLERYRVLVERLNVAIESCEAALAEEVAAPKVPGRPGLAKVETPTGDLGAILDFQERLGELEGVLKVTVTGSARGGTSFLVELAGAPGSQPELVCSSCGKVLRGGTHPPSHGLCDDCRDSFSTD